MSDTPVSDLQVPRTFVGQVSDAARRHDCSPEVIVHWCLREGLRRLAATEDATRRLAKDCEETP